MTVQARETIIVDGQARGLGRVYVPDVRDANYLLADQLPRGGIKQVEGEGVRGTLTPVMKSLIQTGTAPRAAQGAGAMTPLVRTRPWQMGPTMDQDGYPECVLYAWLCWCYSAPMMAGPPGMPKAKALTLEAFRTWCHAGYSWAQDNDEWPGTAYDGTSVRAGAEYLRKQGIITSYHWTWDIPTAKAWVRSSEGGTLVAGTDWFTGMDRIDRHGFIEPTGSWRGGHAWNTYWYSERLNAWRGKLHWGKVFQGNDGGDFWIHNDGMQYLLEALNGEMCAAIQQKA